MCKIKEGCVIWYKNFSFPTVDSIMVKWKLSFFAARHGQNGSKNADEDEDDNNTNRDASDEEDFQNDSKVIADGPLINETSSRSGMYGPDVMRFSESDIKRMAGQESGSGRKQRRNNSGKGGREDSPTQKGGKKGGKGAERWQQALGAYPVVSPGKSS